MGIIKNITKTSSFPFVFVIRFLVGMVFFSEGLQKFLLPQIRGVDRFISMDVIYPEVMSNVVGVMEVVCALLLFMGLFTRVASCMLLFVMFFAVCYSQVPVFVEKGFWAMATSIRTDWSMIWCNIFLMLSGGGKWSFDLRYGGNSVFKGSRSGVR